MANIKITDLTAYTDPLNTDVLPIVDVTSDTTKKVSIADLLKNASAGTAAAPGIAFDGDNTGIYSPGADQVALATNGTGRLFITSDGKVGAGTGAPSGNLDVRGLSGTTIIRAVGVDTNGNADVEIFSTGTTGSSRLFFADTAAQSGSIIYNHSDNSFAFATNGGGERGRLDSSGRLLVNTSSDSGGALLQVNGNRVRIATAKTPASASDTGTTGEICWDADYIYVCTATNTWKRTAIATW
jgi:hypothetical protein